MDNMQNFARPPNPLKDNTAKSWTIWKEEFLIFIDLVGYDKRSSNFKANLFKNLIGTTGIEIINKLSFATPEDKNKLEKLIEKIDNYYNPEDTEINKRYKFFSRSKKSDETMEQYIQQLEVAAKQCNFGIETSTLIRDVVILHTYDKKLRQKLLERDQLTTNNILTIFKDHRKQNTKEKNENKFVNKSNQSNKDNKLNESNKDNKIIKPCWRCQTNHALRNCPARNYKCTICSFSGHFETCCKDRINQPPNPPTKSEPTTSNSKPNMSMPNHAIEKFNNTFNNLNIKS